MDELYALFKRSYIVQPVYYRVGGDYTIRDIVILLAKVHTIALNGVVVKLQNSRYGMVEFGKIVTTRVVDILYVIDRLLRKGYKLVEETLQLTTLLPELQNLIYKQAKSTGKLQRTSKYVLKATNTHMAELCKEYVSLVEIRNWLGNNNTSISCTTKPIITSTKAKIGVATLQWKPKDASLFRDISKRTLATGTVYHSVTEKVGTKEELLTMFYNDMEELYPRDINVILSNRKQCQSTPNYPLLYMANRIEYYWNIAKVGTLADLWLFFKRGHWDSILTMSLVTPKPDHNILVDIGKIVSSILSTDFSGNTTIEAVLPELEKYVQIVVAYLRT